MEQHQVDQIVAAIEKAAKAIVAAIEDNSERVSDLRNEVRQIDQENYERTR